jgi:putative hydrolase of the HAD superfamily
MMVLDSIDAVLLDLYDTVAWSQWPRQLAMMSARLGIKPDSLLEAFDRTRPARNVGTYPDAEGDMNAVLLALGIHDRLLARELVEAEARFLSASLHVYEDALPTVRELRARGVRTALVSNCSHSTRPAVDRLGFEREFDAVVLSFEVGARKPQPAIYQAALTGLGVGAERAVFVDDQAAYCDGARALGMETRLIVRDLGPDRIEGDPVDSNGHLVITSLAALLE